MPNASSRLPRPPLPTSKVVALLVVAMITLACGGGEGSAAGDGSPGPSDSPGAATAAASPSTDPGTAMASGDVHDELCRRIGEVERSLTTMRAVELRLTNRVALEIELGQLQVAVGELEAAELGAFEDDLELPLRRLGYRLDEVELAVEDFRTNSRPQRAVPHVERDSQTFADELAALVLLSRC